MQDHFLMVAFTLLLLAGLRVATSTTPASDAPTFPAVSYAALQIWPMPTSVTLPSSPLGPHAVPTRPNVVHVDKSCGADVQRRLAAFLGNKNAAVFRSPTRTYAEAPSYAAADAFCSKPCSSDSDCAGAGAGAGACYVPAERWWSSTKPCAPSAKYNMCGCCVSGSGLPTIDRLTIDCSGSADDTTASPSESYSLHVNATDIVISASAPAGAAYGIVTLSQLLRFDAKLKQQVVDFVPLAIADAPLLSWRGFMLDTSRHFVETPTILTMLDGMHQAKINGAWVRG